MVISTPIKLLIRCLLVEFIGDIIFVFVGSLSTLSNDLTAIAFGHGLTIAILVIGMGHISGGHFNPAVTLGIAISRKIPILNAILYVIAQLFGGCIGGLLVRAVLQDKQYYAIIGGATMVPIIETTWIRAIVCEVFLTYVLVSTVLIAAVDRNDNMLAPLAIGLSITIDIFAGGGISGASMNPARSFGPCLMATIFADNINIVSKNIWTYHYVYWIGPIIGSIIAAAVYSLVLANDDDRLIMRNQDQYFSRVAPIQTVSTVQTTANDKYHSTPSSSY